MSSEQAPRRPSVLRAFAPVPRRAKQDKRLKASHHRCLLALCDLLDTATGYCLISQRALGKRAALARQKVSDRLDDLETWGYIARIDRGRHSAGADRGRFKIMLYRLVYDAPDSGAVSPTGVTRVEARAVSPTGVAKAVSPTGVTESRLERLKKEGGTSVFRALRAADRFDANVEVARQLELPFPEVQRFDELWHQAVELHGFPKMSKIDLAIRKAHRSQRAYVQALTARLEALLTEPPPAAEAVS